MEIPTPYCSDRNFFLPDLVQDLDLLLNSKALVCSFLHLRGPHITAAASERQALEGSKVNVINNGAHFGACTIRNAVRICEISD